MFYRIKRKIKQGKGKKLRRKNLLFEALVRRGKEVRQGEEMASPQRRASKRRSLEFVEAKWFVEEKEVLIRRHPRVRLGEAYLRQDEGRLSRLKTPAICQGEEHLAGTTNLTFLAYFWPIFPNPINICI